MDYFLTEDQIEIRNLAREIAQKKIAPIAGEFDESQEVAYDIIKMLGQTDLFRVFIPEEYEGIGGGALEMCLVMEELSKACSGIALYFAATSLGTIPIIRYGSEEQKKKYLPKIASGECLAAFALTEANSGSDVAAIKTRAVRNGNTYVINGTKQWISNAGLADVYTVFAVTDPLKGPRGASAFIIEKGTEGFEFGKKENKLGIRANPTRELIFNNVKLLKDSLLSREGMGFIIAMKTFDESRPGVAAQAIGIAQGAFDHACQYSTQRIQKGKPISSFQGIQFMLADMATQIEAARALTYQAAKNFDSGSKEASKAAAMAKLFASDVAMKVTVDSVQIFGGYGFTKDYPVEKMMRDAKITQIYEGTNQIQREIIALNVLKDSKAMS